MYGAEPGKPTFANNCLLARRLVERGARFVQLYHTDWDHHADLGQPLDQVTREIDQPTRGAGSRSEAARSAGAHAGRVGRGIRPHADGRGAGGGKVGRNHHIDAYTLWMAGGGIKAGPDRGRHRRTRLLADGDRIDVHDLHATHAAPAGARSHEADVQVPGPRFPADGRERAA